MNANLSNVRLQLNIHQRKLLIDGKPTKLGARAFDVLLVLVERRGRAVTKDELLDAVGRAQSSKRTISRFTFRRCARSRPANDLDDSWTRLLLNRGSEHV